MCKPECSSGFSENMNFAANLFTLDKSKHLAILHHVEEMQW